MSHVVVVGGGPAGYAAALVAAKRGMRVTLLRGLPRPEDTRTVAILKPQLDFLQAHEVLLDPNLGCPLKSLSMIDVADRLWRAPAVHFHAKDAGFTSFGRSYPNNIIVDQLATLTEKSGVTIRDVVARDLQATSEGWSVTTDDGDNLITPFIIAADGKSSFIRESAGLPMKVWDYPQVALAFDVAHKASHADTSTEFHTNEGPLTTVPLRQGVSGVVWMVSPERATRLTNSKPDIILTEMATITGTHLGMEAIISPVTCWPLKGLMATELGRDGLVLVGESAHAFPPIGAQGFNLTLRDARTLAHLFDTMQPQSSADFKTLSTRYHEARINDVGFRVRMVDWLDRSLLEPFSLKGAGRILGLTLLANVPILRKQVMRFGMRS